MLKETVNKLQLIQLGLTFFDDDGNLPTCGIDQYCVWQFNFQFDPRQDLPDDATELIGWFVLDLKDSKEKGIDATTFCDQLKSFGVISPDKNQRWVTFCGGLGFGYFIKMLSGVNLPKTLQEVFEKIKEFFPVVYDMKHVMKYPFVMNKLGQDDQQAGGASLLRSCVFVKLKELHSEKHFEDQLGDN